jgi:hypothetical protein
MEVPPEGELTYRRFASPRVVFVDEDLNAARAKIDPIEMLQMWKPDGQIHAGLPELLSSVLQTV